MAEQGNVRIQKGNWDSVHVICAQKGHPPVVVFATRSDYGRGTPEALVRAAQSLLGDNANPIIFKSCDPAFMDHNYSGLKARHLEGASEVVLVYNNGGPPEIYPHP